MLISDYQKSVVGSSRYLTFTSSILLICSLIYAPLLTYFIGIVGAKYILLVFYGLSITISVFFYKRFFLYNRDKLFVITSFFLIAGACFTWIEYSKIGTYLSVIIAISVFSLRLEASILTLLKRTLFISVLIGLVEFFSGNYFYVVSVNVGGSLVELNESLYSGALDIFRSKGLFEGPLTFSQYIVFMSLLFINKERILVICLIGALLTASRMAIFVVFGILLYNLYSNRFTQYIKTRKYINLALLVSVVLGLFSGAIVYVLNNDTDYFSRLLEIFDFTSSASNVTRIYYWSQALNIFSEYSMSEVLFGKAGYYQSLMGNNAESGWLTLLVDNGILGFSLYFFPYLILLLISFYLKNYTIAFCCLVVIVVNSTMTFYLSSSGNFLYWFCLFFWVLLLSGKVELKN